MSRAHVHTLHETDKLSTVPMYAAADPDFFPSLDQGLGPPPKPSEDDATVSAFMSVLSTPAHRQARRTANQMLQKLIQGGFVPKDTTLEGAARLMLRGESWAAVRLCGLQVVQAVSALATLLLVMKFRGTRLIAVPSDPVSLVA